MAPSCHLAVRMAVRIGPAHVLETGKGGWPHLDRDVLETGYGGWPHIACYSPPSASRRRVLREDSPDLADDGGVVLAQVARRDERLGRDPLEMGTLIRDQAVAPAGTGRVGAGPR